MTNFRKALATLLSLALALCAFPALAASGDITIFRQGLDGMTDSLRAMAYYDSTLYVFTYGDEYYTWTRESGALEEHPFDQSFMERDGGGYVEFRTMMAGPDGLYALLISNEPVEDDENGNTTFEEARLCKVVIGGEGAISFDDGVELDWDDMLDSYDDFEYSREVRFPFISGNTLAFTTYGNSGRNNTVFAYDITTGEYEMYELEIEGVTPGIEGMCRYTQGKALIASYSYGTQDEPVVFYALDLLTGEATEALTVPTKNYSVPSNLLYDEAGDALYYTLSGELFKVPGLDADKVVSVAAVQIDSWSDKSPALTADGYFICSDYETIIARNTDPTARAETTLTVFANYYQPMEDAYYAFANAHPDVDVVLASSYEDITEAMMNQSDSVDIYTLNVSSEDYGALYDRGYLADLSGSQMLMDTVTAMYPGIRAVAMKDGALYALPVEMYANCWSYSPKAAEKLGLAAEDMPGTWMEFLQFLQRAPELVGDSAVTVFETYMTQDDARYNIFYNMLNDYMMYLKKTEGAEMSFDTELMRGLLAEFDKIDFSGFGLMESYEDEPVSYSRDESNILFMNYNSISVDAYMYQADYALPMPLALADGTDPMIQAEMTVAIVNPYSKNKDLAIQYLECAVKEYREVFLANTSPDRNDPIRNAYYEENLGYYEEQIASLQDALESAKEDEKADWQARLDEMQGYYEEFQEYGAWDANEESIAAYRQFAPYLQIMEYFGLDNDNAGEFYSNVQQYLDGTIDGSTMLANIDKKLKMMLQEGL